MNKLLLLPLLLTACTSAKFMRGDCITPGNLEVWDDAKQAANYKALILDVGQKSYRVLAPSPFGYVPMTAKITDLDERFAKGECPLGFNKALDQFPSLTQ